MQINHGNAFKIIYLVEIIKLSYIQKVKKNKEIN